MLVRASIFHFSDFRFPISISSFTLSVTIHNFCTSAMSEPNAIYIYSMKLFQLRFLKCSKIPMVLMCRMHLSSCILNVIFVYSYGIFSGELRHFAPCISYNSTATNNDIATVVHVARQFMSKKRTAERLQPPTKIIMVLSASSAMNFLQCLNISRKSQHEYIK